MLEQLLRTLDPQRTALFANYPISIFLTLILVSTLCIHSTFAQDYTRWNLPEGAKARIGKGFIRQIAYSPDGTRLAVASSIGTWIYDAQTGEELDLLTGHTEYVRSVAFSPDGLALASGVETEPCVCGMRKQVIICTH